MKTTTLLAFALIALGIVTFGYYGVVTYTTQDKVIDLGPLQVTAEKTHTVPIAPIAGSIVLVTGMVLLVAGNKKE